MAYDSHRDVQLTGGCVLVLMALVRGVAGGGVGTGGVGNHRDVQLTGGAGWVC